MKEKKFDRKKQLLEAALEEFITADYERASLNTIIKNAGISKGVFYYHFENKESLYLALLEDAVEKKWHYIQSRVSENASDLESTDIFGQFMFQARLGVEFANAYPKFNRLSQMFAKEKGNPIYEKAVAQLKTSDANPLQLMISKAYAQKLFKETFSLEFVTKLITHLFSSFDTILGPEDDLDTVLKTLENYIAFMKHGLIK